MRGSCILLFCFPVFLCFIRAETLRVSVLQAKSHMSQPPRLPAVEHKEEEYGEFLSMVEEDLHSEYGAFRSFDEEEDACIPSDDSSCYLPGHNGTVDGWAGLRRWLANPDAFSEDFYAFVFSLMPFYIDFLAGEDMRLVFMDKFVAALAALYGDSGKPNALSMLFVDPLFPAYYRARSILKSTAALSIRDSWLKLRNGQSLTSREKADLLGAVLVHTLDLACVLGVLSDPVWARLTALGLIDVPAHLMREVLALCFTSS
jgi:hypothetical protein